MHSTSYLLIIRFISNHNKNTQYFCQYNITFTQIAMTKRKSKRSFIRESTSKPSSTRKHVICNCNICQGAEVDPRTKASHMKKREISRGLTDRTPEGLPK